MPKGYNGYVLTDDSRKALLDAVLPKHPDVVAHHITHAFNVYDELPPDVTTATVVAYAENDIVQAAIVKVDGTSLRAYGDSFYHVTISVDRTAGGTPFKSNDLISDSRNWVSIGSPFDIDIIPTFFPFESK